MELMYVPVAMCSSKPFHKGDSMQKKSRILLFLMLFISSLNTLVDSVDDQNCHASRCLTANKISKKKLTCSAGVYSEYCGDDEYLCCEESDSCKGGYGKCIDLRHHKCPSKKLVLGYCEDRNNSASNYKAFCCQDAAVSDYEHGVYVAGWTLFCLLFCVFWFIALGDLYIEKEYWIHGYIVGHALFFLFILILTGVNYHLHGNTAGVAFGWTWTFVSLAIAFPIIYYKVDYHKYFLIALLAIGLPVVLLLAIEGIYQKPESHQLYYPPSSYPTGIPSSMPSISIQPTITCTAGWHLTEVGTCEKCNPGKYTDKANQLSCDSCEPWTWTSQSGSSSCDYATARNSLHVAFPIIFCSIYGLLSIASYYLSIQLGAEKGTIITVALITSDQVTDILYSWGSLFANPALLALSSIFCIANFAFPLLFLLYHMSPFDLLMIAWVKGLGKAYNEFARKIGHYKDDEEPEYSAWVLHAILGFNLGKFFPFSLLFLPFDFLWILLRIFLTIIVIICALISQIILLPIGSMLYVNKLMCIPSVYSWFWSHWNSKYLEQNPQESKDDTAATYNALVLLEVFSECIPQVTIQLANTGLILGKDGTWPTLTVLSLSFSIAMIVSILHHFWFEHQELLKTDSSYHSFDFKKIPKFDLVMKFNQCSTNHRKVQIHVESRSNEIGRGA
jgi:hypothetical protein